MKKNLLIKILNLLVVTVLSMNTPVLAFEGSQPHTQTLIVSSQILNKDGQMIDPESNAKENQDTFLITVHFSNLNKDDRVTCTDGVIIPENDGTAEYTYKSGNCTPRYFDNVPVTAKIVVTEDPGSYQAAYETFDFISDTKKSASKGHMTLTTKELQMKEGKDGFVLFSNQKAGVLSEIMAVTATVLIVITLITVSLVTGIMLYRRHRRRLSE